LQASSVISSVFVWCCGRSKYESRP
jgi:hypothetical protein